MARSRKKKPSRQSARAGAGGARGVDLAQAGRRPEGVPSLELPGDVKLTSLGLRGVAEVRDAVRPGDREELARLASGVRRARGFGLYLAECASPAYRDRLIGLLAGLVDTPPVEVNLDPGLESGATSAVDILALAARDAPAGAPLLAVGLESLLFAAKDRANAVLRDLNLRRAVLAGLGRPLVFWLPEHAHRALARQAPDLHDWYSGSYVFTSGEQPEPAVMRPEPVATGDRAALWSLAEADKRAMVRTLESMLQERQGREDAESVDLGLQLAELHFSLGEPRAALEQFTAARAAAEALGNRDLQAQAMGHAGRVLAQFGRVDEALAMHQEMLKIFEDLGDRRSRAMTLGDIARIYSDKGRVDEALALHEEQLKVYEDLGDSRSRAVTLGDIAHILRNKGRVDEALVLHEEQLKVYENLGDRRERAVTLGDIARIYTDKGRVDEALALLEEALKAYEELGDVDGIANSHWSLFQVLHVKGDSQAAGPHLVQAYELVLKLGRLDGICVVGRDYGPALWANGQRDEARAVLKRSIAGFAQLGRPDQAEQTRQILARLEQKGEGQEPEDGAAAPGGGREGG